MSPLQVRPSRTRRERDTTPRMARHGSKGALTLASLPDDALQEIIAAFVEADSIDYLPRIDLPDFEDVKGLGCTSKGMRQQLHRLQPLVGVQDLTAMQRSSHRPWRVALLYEGPLTDAVLEQARQGRAHSIVCTGMHNRTLAPAMAGHVIPALLGAGCSLLEFHLIFVDLGNTWVSIFGEAAVCSTALRSLSLDCCGLRGPLPQLRLPALQRLDYDDNDLDGGLEPLRGCTALVQLTLSRNNLTGGLEALRSCTGLELLHLSDNYLTGTLEPLRGCTKLKDLRCSGNQLTGGLDALGGCTGLDTLLLDSNFLTGGLEPLRRCTALTELFVGDNQLMGGLDALRGCTALRRVSVEGNRLLVPSDEDKARLEAQCLVFLS